MLGDKNQDYLGRYVSYIGTTQIILLLVPPHILKAHHHMHNTKRAGVPSNLCDFAHNVNEFLVFNWKLSHYQTTRPLTFYFLTHRM